jgi:uncharacterized protein (DUF3084 family)
MDEDVKHQTTHVRRRRRHRTTVTNITIFALGSGVHAGQTRAVEAPTCAQVEDEDLSGERLVSSEWLERRAKRFEKQEQELKQRALEIERRELELDEREARFEADMYLREDEIEAREQHLRELETRLGQKESDLGVFVSRVQRGLLADAS